VGQDAASIRHHCRNTNVVRNTFMRDWIRRLSNRNEILLVLLIAIGYFLFVSTLHFLQITTSPAKQWNRSFDNFGGIQILIYEFVAGVLIILILRERNWKLEDFNLGLKVKSFVHGLGLVLLTLFIVGLINFMIAKSGLIKPIEDTVKTIKFKNEMNIVIWGLLIIFNSFFEESLYNGYLHKRLGDNNIVFLGVSTSLRVALHLYQGILNAIPITILSLVYGTYYIRYRQLTPLIIGHGLWNLFYVIRTT